MNATSSTFIQKKNGGLPFELQWDHAKVLHLFQDWYPIRHHHEVTSSPWHLDSMDNLLSYKKIKWPEVGNLTQKKWSYLIFPYLYLVGAHLECMF